MGLQLPPIPRLFTYDALEQSKDFVELLRTLKNNDKSLIAYFERLNRSFEDSVQSITATTTIVSSISFTPENTGFIIKGGTSTQRTLTVDIDFNSSSSLFMTGVANRIQVTGNTTLGQAGSVGTIDISPNYIGQNSITTVGTITTGNWNGQPIPPNFTIAKVNSVTGTLNRIVITGPQTNPTVDIDITYTGQTSITTLGTITTGDWSNGSVKTINPSAVLELISTTKGFLPPRMTTAQRDLVSASEGMIIYNLTTHSLQSYNGSSWVDIGGGTVSISFTEDDILNLLYGYKGSTTPTSDNFSQDQVINLFFGNGTSLIPASGITQNQVLNYRFLSGKFGMCY